MNPALRTGSLRVRVAVSVVALLLLSLAGLGLIVNYVLGNRLNADLDSRLLDRAYHAQALMQQNVSGTTLASAVNGGGFDARYVTSSGRVLAASTPPQPPAGRPGTPPAPKPVPGEPTPQITRDGDQLQVALTDSGGRLLITTSRADVEHTLTELRSVELVAGAGVLVIGALLSLAASRVALAPLARMTGVARRIRDGERGRRLRPTRPATDLGRTAAAFDDMLDALESAERRSQAAEARMRQFLADASHDLRTPLAGVIAGSESILRQPLTVQAREQRLVEVIREARRAGRLVEDLLLIPRLEPDAADARPAAQPVDLAALAARALDGIRLRHPDLTVSGWCPPVSVVGDADQLARAVANVLDNAGRAAAPVGRVDVNAQVSAGWLTLRITDSGPGVAPADRERIFDRFVRLDASRTEPGSGLGLPIARAVARRHGGDLVCTGSSSGACFEFRLPVLVRMIEAREPLASPMVAV